MAKEGEAKSHELTLLLDLLCDLDFLFVFQNRVSLCSPGCPGTHSVDQAGFKLRNLPAPAPAPAPECWD